MKTIKIISAILGLCVMLPISVYLQYWIISQLNANRLIWFLFFANIPIFIFVSLIQKLIEDD